MFKCVQSVGGMPLFLNLFFFCMVFYFHLRVQNVSPNEFECDVAY